jgi:pimeloyl-ACP methyl ester carboxylesterase
VPFARCQHAGRIHYAERGETRPDRRPVLLVHGAGASSAIWMMVLARLGRHTRVVAIDLPGHGPSPPGVEGEELAPSLPTLQRYRDAVGELGASLGLGPSVLVGHSMGALVVLEAALAWPDKVAGLALCAAAPRLPVSAELVRLIRDDYAAVPAWIADHGLSPAARPAVRRGFVAAGVAAPREVTLADFAAIAEADLGSRMHEIRCPMVWLDGADDRMVGAAARTDRPGEVHSLLSVGHLLPIECPEAIAQTAVTLAKRGP